MIKSNFDSFFKDFNKEVEKHEKEQELEAKKIVINAYTNIVRLSPVDKSFFKANHFLSFNTKFTENLEGGEPTKEDYRSETNIRLDETLADIKSANLRKIKKIYIQNNLPYARALEDGHSTQAPKGMYRITEERTRKLLKKKA